MPTVLAAFPRWLRPSLVYSIFTGAAALSRNVWQLGLFRLLTGIGVGGEWALAGTYVAEAWAEDRRKMGAGYLQTGYYFGFFLASALNFTVGARYGWCAMFWCGLAPVVVALLVQRRVKESERWERKTVARLPGEKGLWRTIFAPPYTQRTLVNTVLLASAICELWAGAVYAPTAVISLAKRAGMTQAEAVRVSSLGMCCRSERYWAAWRRRYLRNGLGESGPSLCTFSGWP